MRRIAFALAFAGLALGVGPVAVWAQDGAASGPLRSPLVTIDQEKLFTESAFGQSLIARVEQDSTALAAENRKIEAELLAEEKALTDERPTLDPVAFREKASAFDEKVVAIRKAQDDKARSLIRQREAAQKEFFNAALPVLSEIARERGAVAVMDSRSVIMSAGQIDITADAIDRVDARLAPVTPDAAPVDTPTEAK
ncbi:OmpH family outer membrane protein [Actibacterium sp.]|uniref:OmpH family outer membrane protein n=1 Tax=Actibacterium sp. TaxID=1872125 RepID=UPI00356A25AF